MASRSVLGQLRMGSGSRRDQQHSHQGPTITVVSVGDGDSIRVRQGENTISVRLA